MFSCCFYINQFRWDIISSGIICSTSLLWNGKPKAVSFYFSLSYYRFEIKRETDYRFFHKQSNYANTLCFAQEEADWPLNSLGRAWLDTADISSLRIWNLCGRAKNCSSSSIHLRLAAEAMKTTSTPIKANLKVNTFTAWFKQTFLMWKPVFEVI